MIVTTPERFREALTDEVISEILFYINEPSPGGESDPLEPFERRCVNVGDSVIDAVTQAFKEDQEECEPDDHGMTQKDFLMPEHAA